MNGSFPGFGPGHWGVVLVLWLPLIIGLVVLYFAILKRSRHEDGTDLEQKSALQILQQRYARGEINDDEFAEKKRQLEQ